MVFYERLEPVDPDVGVGDPGGADPHWVGVLGEADVGDPGAGGLAGEDQVGQGAAVAGAVAQDHVDLLGFVQAHGDPVGEQVADRQDLLARVLQCRHHRIAIGTPWVVRVASAALMRSRTALSGW
jgi:hypothetical protein